MNRVLICCLLALYLPAATEGTAPTETLRTWLVEIGCLDSVQPLIPLLQLDLDAPTCWDPCPVRARDVNDPDIRVICTDDGFMIKCDIAKKRLLSCFVLPDAPPRPLDPKAHAVTSEEAISIAKQVVAASGSTVDFSNPEVKRVKPGSTPVWSVLAFYQINNIRCRAFVAVDIFEASGQVMGIRDSGPMSQPASLEPTVSKQDAISCALSTVASAQGVEYITEEDPELTIVCPETLPAKNGAEMRAGKGESRVFWRIKIKTVRNGIPSDRPLFVWVDAITREAVCEYW